MGWLKKQIRHDSIIDAYYFEISLSALEQTLGYICYWRGWPRSLVIHQCQDGAREKGGLNTSTVSLHTRKASRTCFECRYRPG